MQAEATAFSQEEEEEKRDPHGTEKWQPRQETSQKSLARKLGPQVTWTEVPEVVSGPGSERWLWPEGVLWGGGDRGLAAVGDRVSEGVSKWRD